MNTSEEKDVSLITMRHIRALAGKRGYRVQMGDAHLVVTNKNDEQITCSFDVPDPFCLDPLCTQQCTFMRVYLWIRGYDLTYEEPTMVRIERARRHPAWHPELPRRAQFAYHSTFLLFGEIAAWVQYLETHHCPLMDPLPLQKEVSATDTESWSI